MKLPSLRFGFLTLFSLMLLAVSAAGFVREHWPGGDRQEILDALADEGIDFHSSSLNGQLVRLVLFGDPSEETLDKIYALRSIERVERRPREQTFEQTWNALDNAPTIEPNSPRLPQPPSPPTAEQTFGLAPIEYDMEESAASDEAPELSGRTLSGHERRELIVAVMQAWRNARDEFGERWTGACGLREKRLDASSGEWVDDGWITLEAIVRDGETTATYAYRYGATTSTLRTPEGDLRRDFQFGAWKEIVADRGTPRDELGRNVVGDGRLEPPYAGPMRWRGTLFETDPEETFESASLLDDGRFLLRLRPRPLDPLPPDPTDRPSLWGRRIPKPSRIAGGYLIVDPLLKYAVVRSDVDSGYPAPLEETETYRSTIEYEVVQGRSVPVRVREYERTPTVGGSQVRMGYESTVVYSYRWDFDPKVDPTFLTLSRLPSRSLRTRATSQIAWPWATLALGVVGLGFALARTGRAFAAPHGRTFAAVQPTESGVSSELDEPAAPL